MDYRTEVLHIDPQFPFAVYHGRGFSPDEYERGASYMHRHHSLEINYCLHGQGRYLIGEQVYPVEPGDLFFINDLEYHQAIDVSGDTRLLVIVFDADLVLSGGADYALIRTFYEWKTGFKHRIVADSPIVADIAPILLELDREWTQQEIACQLVIRALLIKLLALLYRGFERTEGYSEQTRQFQSGYVRLSPAMAMIDSQFREALTLEQLANSVHMNRNYFSTLFTRLMGCPVSEYLIRRRLHHAVQLLMSTDASVIAIALDSGFRNVSYFSRAFHRHFGLSPGRYREQVRMERR
ncbi:MAG: helix-turn-helix domain-containing protein [Aristaeellaceae bacterium]